VLSFAGWQDRRPRSSGEGCGYGAAAAGAAGDRRSPDASRRGSVVSARRL